MFENLKNFFSKNLSSKKVIIIIIAIIVIYTIYHIFNNNSKTTMHNKLVHKKSVNNNQNLTDNQTIDNELPQYKLYNFYSPHCTHCVQFKPEWANVENRLASIKNLQLISVDGTNPDNDKLMFYFNIEGYPTVILTTPDNGNLLYNGNRNADDIENFVLSSMNS